MAFIPTLQQAEEILAKYNKEPFHIQHAKTVSGVLGYFAQKYDADSADFWKVVGMLHDIDFEMYPEEHCVKGVEIMLGEDIDDSVVKSALSHGYGLTAVEFEPQSVMEKILYATDELTGLIGAAVLMRPSKSVSDLECPSVMKKFKDKKFAAGCSRDAIKRGADMLGWTLDELIAETILAMRGIE
jgi:predicted hydrolase (HD superfamily)